MSILGNDGQSGSSGGKGGRGGDGGEAGFPGDVIVNGKTVQQQNGHSNSAESGKDGSGGKNGKQGRSSGDIGCIDWAWNSDALTFFGTSYDQRLEIEYFSYEPKNVINALCYPYSDGSDRRATIKTRYNLNNSRNCQTTREEKNQVTRTKKLSAVKKKAILLSDVSEHIDEISRRKTDLGCFVEDICQGLGQNSQDLQTLGEESSAVEEEKSEEKIEENIQLVRQFKKKEVVSNDNEESKEVLVKDGLAKRLTCKNCREYLGSTMPELPHNENISLSTDMMSKSLVKCRTLTDSNNILHSIFGVKNSDDIFICENWIPLRQDLATFVKTELAGIQDLLESVVEKFVLSLTDGSLFPAAFQLKRQLEEFEQQKSLQWKLIVKEAAKEENASAQKWIKHEFDDSPSLNFQQDLKNCSVRFQRKVNQFLSPFNWKVFTASSSSSDVLNDYSEFILNMVNTLGQPELELIAIAFRKKIHIFEESDILDQPLMHVETIGQDSVVEHSILMNPDKSFQPLEWDGQLKEFHEKRKHQIDLCIEKSLRIFDFVATGTRSSVFQELLEFAEENNKGIECAAIKRIDPEYGVPDIFSGLLLKNYQEEKDFIPAEDLCQLVEKLTSVWTLSDDKSSGYLLWNLMTNICPHVWKDELIILEIEDCLQHVFNPEERVAVKKCLHTLPDDVLRALRYKLTKITVTSFLSLVQLFSVNLRITETDLERLQNLSLGDWIYELKIKYWERKIDDMSTIHVSSASKKKELVYFMLELDAIQGHEHCEKLLSDPDLTWKKLKTNLYFEGGFANEYAASSGSERSFDEILNIMSRPGQTSNMETINFLRT